MVLAVVQHLLPSHALGGSGRHIIGYTEEVDDLPQEHGGVCLGLESPQSIVGTYALPSRAPS
ncbi:hypothetical protein ADK86_12915 [Streptomyces sp. NRRL F-5755]|nr:hypothetical protein ADK86_12915 [Streptomyces sp. NRRL F-5755]